MRGVSAVPTALLVGALLAAGATSVAASPGAAPVSLSKTSAHVGELVEVSGEAGREGLNWVASGAFVRQQDDPYPGDGGSARVHTDRDGHFHGTARIAAVPPGSYPVSVRIGGGNAGSVTIKVVAR